MLVPAPQVGTDIGMDLWWGHTAAGGAYDAGNGLRTTANDFIHPWTAYADPVPWERPLADTGLVANGTGAFLDAATGEEALRGWGDLLEPEVFIPATIAFGGGVGLEDLANAMAPEPDQMLDLLQPYIFMGPGH